MNLLDPDDPQLVGQADDLFAPHLLAIPDEWLSSFPDWFDAALEDLGTDPEGDKPMTKLWIDSQGRAAAVTWDARTCLIDGNESECWNPVPSPTGYEAFHQNSAVLVSGRVVDAGIISGRGHHAPRTMTFEQAAHYYDNVGDQLVVGRAFDAQLDGVWRGYFIGAVLPDRTVGDVAMVRRSGVSCDWRWRLRDNGGRPLNSMDNLGPWLVTRPGLPLDRRGAQRPSRMRFRLASVQGIDHPPLLLLPDDYQEEPMPAPIVPEPTVSNATGCSCQVHTAAAADGTMPAAAPADQPAAGTSDALVALQGEMAEMRSALDAAMERVGALEATVGELMLDGLTMADLADPAGV